MASIYNHKYYCNVVYGVFISALPSQLSLIFASKVRAYLSGAPYRTPSKGKLVLSTNIRLEWKGLWETNRLGYNNMELITTVSLP
jgi:hypothetical protein